MLFDIHKCIDPHYTSCLNTTNIPLTTSNKMGTIHTKRTTRPPPNASPYNHYSRGRRPGGRNQADFSPDKRKAPRSPAAQQRYLLDSILSAEGCGILAEDLDFMTQDFIKQE